MVNPVLHLLETWLSLAEIWQSVTRGPNEFIFACGIISNVMLILRPWEPISNELWAPFTLEVGDHCPLPGGRPWTLRGIPCVVYLLFSWLPGIQLSTYLGLRALSGDTAVTFIRGYRPRLSGTLGPFCQVMVPFGWTDTFVFSIHHLTTYNLRLHYDLVHLT